jgi:hypothetical protein
VLKMAALPKTISQDAGKPDAAVLLINGCAAGAAAPGEAKPSPFNSQLEYALESWPFENAWERRFNVEVWGSSQTWRNDATGWSYDD